MYCKFNYLVLANTFKILYTKAFLKNLQSNKVRKHESIYYEFYYEGCSFSPQSKQLISPKLVAAREVSVFGMMK